MSIKTGTPLKNKQTLQLFAVCEVTNTIITFNLAQRMKLPISRGWDYWVVAHNERQVKFDKYSIARRYVLTHRTTPERVFM